MNKQTITAICGCEIEITGNWSHWEEGSEVFDTFESVKISKTCKLHDPKTEETTSGISHTIIGKQRDRAPQPEKTLEFPACCASFVALGIHHENCRNNLMSRKSITEP